MKRITGVSNALVAFAVAIVATSVAQAETVAYWRFEDGPADTDVTHIAGADNTFSADILDVSGNGNHLSTWNTGGCCGYQYRGDVSGPVVSGTGASNNFSVKNTGGGPGMFTSSAGSMPTGVDIDTMTPSAFTVEASWKLENGGYRTLVGRDAQNVSTNTPAAAALYLQARPGNRIGIQFTDVAGNTHEAFTDEGAVQGFDFGADPNGLNAPWYHLVGVSDGSTLKMYVNNTLVASSPIVSADPSLAVGTTSSGDWHAGGWSVGRGLFNGGHGDRAYGFIDEVRISNHALHPSEFLHAVVPEPTSAALLALGAIVALTRGRKA
jgi:Concanavalin A-like lectin/glucanases superfamily